MFRMAKAMTVAAMIATGLPLLTETAGAQTPNTWNYVTPYQCAVNDVPDVSGQMTSELIVLAYEGFRIDVRDSEIISTVAKGCDELKPFYVFYRPGQVYQTEFYFSSFSGAAGAPLTGGLNYVQPLYCTSQQEVDDPALPPQPHTTLWVVTQYYSFGVYDSRAIAAIARICWEGGGFWGYPNGIWWNNFQFHIQLQ